MKSNLVDLQNTMLGLNQVDCPVSNHFTDGCYARQLTIPAGCCIVGAKHKTNHFFMLASGECFISEGGKAEKHIGPSLMTTKAGTKRAITAITDTVIITFHVTDKTDIEEIGDDILEDEQTALPQWKSKLLEAL